MDPVLTSADELVDLTAGDKIPCDYWLDKNKSCLHVVHDDRRFHYGQPQISPKMVVSLCTGCRAHYYAQMARNAIIEHKRSR